MFDRKVLAILSFFIPGLGQLLSGDIKKGATMLLITLLLNITIAYFINNALGTVIRIAYSLYAAYDVYVLSSNN